MSLTICTARDTSMPGPLGMFCRAISTCSKDSRGQYVAYVGADVGDSMKPQVFGSLVKES